MTKPTVSEVLFEVYGSDFSRATQDQRLGLLEDVVVSLRTGVAWGESWCASPYGGAFFPLVTIPLHLERNEGLKLLTVLNEAIVEGYSVLLATERGLHD